MPLLIDEWQEVPEVLWAVKAHVDASTQPGQFIITGSIRGDNRQQMPLTGRVEAINMFPLSVAERRGALSNPMAERLFNNQDLETSDTD